MLQSNGWLNWWRELRRSPKHAGLPRRPRHPESADWMPSGAVEKPSRAERHTTKRKISLRFPFVRSASAMKLRRDTGRSCRAPWRTALTQSRSEFP